MKTILKIQNLKCEGCGNTIRKKLNKLPYVEDLNVMIEDGIVSFNTVSHNETERIALELSEMGYPVSDEKNSLGKKAKSFVSCAIGRISS
ncbi:heavy-metal-associated domain-containing protein [Maribacter sp. 2210JD10-5]|uniref:heavy-metal-associated domain-containing protein n=1 Tax=Maribacter sp. 2210JD10-5 TaxID=3386272 RepID=UPI0039BD33A9